MIQPVLPLLLVGHALADFPLQGDFMAQAKNHRAPIAGVPFGWPLMFHAMIHAGAVFAVTGNTGLATAEFVAHMLIDFEKCKGSISFSTDQALHVACKILWSVLA